MSDLIITRISDGDRQAMEAVDALLVQEGIRRDTHLDYTCAIFDDGGRIIATGSCFRNTLRCLAVSSDHQGEDLLSRIVTHLIAFQAARGNLHLFLYTKPSSARFFASLGFHEIAGVPGRIVFMENRRDGFPSYLRRLSQDLRDGVSSAIVMNADPFTLGHRYLVERAARSSDALHLFVISEDLSPVPANVRLRLVREGTADLDNVIVHECGPYLISAATFPGYFLKDETDMIRSQARLDTAVFLKIAETLQISERWVGEEPFSEVTAVYNRVLSEELPAAGIRLREIPRLCVFPGGGSEDGSAGDGITVSATAVRRLLAQGRLAEVRALVPETTWNYLISDEARSAADRIRREETAAN